MKYSHKIEELKNDELKLVSDEAGTIDSVIITKEMILWIIWCTFTPYIFWN